ncbi:MAG: hypothetical protein U5O39_02715 [Gammaproteobacteria bacterium]|nr:hypothetical protein [Gammaproteobacteria bacterium]
MLKLFMNGHGEASFDELVHHELFGWLFPDARRVLETTPAHELIGLALASTDQRIAQEKPVTPAFVFAAVLWYPFVEAREKLLEADMPLQSANHEAAATVIGKQQLVTSIPKRFSGPARDIWSLQYRLPVRHGKKAEGTFPPQAISCGLRLSAPPGRSWRGARRPRPVVDGVPGSGRRRSAADGQGAGRRQQRSPPPTLEGKTSQLKFMRRPSRCTLGVFDESYRSID